MLLFLILSVLTGLFGLIMGGLQSPLDGENKEREMKKKNKKKSYLKIFKAIKNEDLDMLNTLMNNNCDVNIRHPWLREPLLIKAVEKGNLIIIQKLLDNGALVDILDINAVTPLYIAVRNSKIDIVKLLINTGADLNKLEVDGTPLEIAVETENIEIIKCLINAGANPNIRHVVYPLLVAVKKGNTEIVKQLLKGGADPNINILWLAVNNGNIEVVRQLLKAGADPSVRSPEGKTILQIADEHGDKDIIQLLKDSFFNRNDSSNMEKASLDKKERRVKSNNEHLEVIYGDSPIEIKLKSIRILGESKDPKMLKELVKIMNGSMLNAPVSIQNAAAEAIRELTGSSANAALEALHIQQLIASGVNWRDL